MPLVDDLLAFGAAIESVRCPSFKGSLLFTRLFEEGSLEVFGKGRGNFERLLKISQ